MRRETGLSVLLIEPHPDTREMYAEYLRECGCQVVAIDADGDVLPLAEGADVVVTEIRLPGSVGGLETLRRLRGRESTRHTPVVVLTTWSLPAYRDAARDAGCDAFLAKPCLPSLLVDELVRLVGRRGARQAPQG